MRFLTSSSSLRIVPVPLPLPLLFCICVCPFSVCSFFFSFLRVSCPSSYFCLFSSFSFSSYSSFFFLFLFFRLLSRSLFFFLSVFLLLILCCFFFFFFLLILLLEVLFPSGSLSVCLLGWSFFDFVFSTTGPHPFAHATIPERGCQDSSRQKLMNTEIYLYMKCYVMQ